MLWRISRTFLNEQLPAARGDVLFWISLCNLCVLCVSVVSVCHQLLNHRDTEDTEIAQRKPNQDKLLGRHGFAEVGGERGEVGVDGRRLSEDVARHEAKDHV